MKRFTIVASLITLVAVSACSDQTAVLAPDGARFGVTPFGPVTVMSRNLYLGANIDPLLAGGPIGAAMQELLYTNYPARAARLALEIATHQPQVVGLQEVTNYTFTSGVGVPNIDFLNILSAYLGGTYKVAVRQNNVSLTLPLGGGQTVTYTDGDAILVRNDVKWKEPSAGHYDNQVSLTVGGYEFENLRGWVAVSVQLNNWWYRFVSTHLEIQAFKPYQEAQAEELVGLIKNQPLPVILVGDFNSAANESAPAAAKTASYATIDDSGYTDLWTLQDNGSDEGLTCCQASNLANATSSLDQRLDIVWVRDANNRIVTGSSVTVFGNNPATDRFVVPSTFTPNGYYLWPSDHAGVFASITFAPEGKKE